MNQTTAITEKPMEYTLANGQEMKLTMGMVRKYLVQGNPNLVSDQEILLYMNICRDKKLNPFTRDCYIIKYDKNPAAIITSVDYFRRAARQAPDCKGWKCGPIVQNEETKELRYSKGLILENEVLVGGWFEAKPAGWDYPFELEVPLAPYIKKTKMGATTQFWRKENQSVMIRKVAESQGLRELWGDQLQGFYSHEEAEAIQVNMQRSEDGFYQDSPAGATASSTIKKDTTLYESSRPSPQPASENLRATQKDDNTARQLPQPDPPPQYDWDPLNEPLQQAYRADKQKVLDDTAAEMQIDISDCKTGREKHIAILKADEDKRRSETEQIEKSVSVKEKFHAQLEQEALPAEMKVDIRKALILHSQATEKPIEHLMKEALEDFPGFIDNYRQRLSELKKVKQPVEEQDPESEKEPEPETPEEGKTKVADPDQVKEERDDLVDLASSMIRYNSQRWDAVVKTAMHDGTIQSNQYEYWSNEQLQYIIDEWQKIEDMQSPPPPEVKDQF